MSKTTVHLVDPEEQHIVEVDARDARAFERHGYKDLGVPPGLQNITTTAPQNMLHWMAYNALTTRAGVALTWAQFDARCTRVESATDVPDPTQPGPTPG